MKKYYDEDEDEEKIERLPRIDDDEEEEEKPITKRKRIIEEDDEIEKKEEEFEEKGIGSKLDELIGLNKELVGRKKMTHWKMPRGGKLTKSQIRKNYVTMIVVNENKELDFIKVPIDEGTTLVDGTPRIATTDYVMTFKGKPVIFQPKWSVRPFSPTSHQELTVKNQDSAAGYKLLLNKMKKEVISPKKTMSGVILWIIIGLVVIGGAYYLFKSGKLGI